MQPLAKDSHLIALLEGRRGSETKVLFSDGASLIFHDLEGYSYDAGEEFALVTVKAIGESKDDGETCFQTNEITQLLDVESGRQLLTIEDR